MIPRLPLTLSLFAFAIASGLLPCAQAQETQEAAPALHDQVAAESADAEARLKLVEERLIATLDDAQKAEFASAQQKWIDYRDASASLTLALAKPTPEQSDYLRYLELNKLTRDRISQLERLASAAAPK